MIDYHWLYNFLNLIFYVYYLLHFLYHLMLKLYMRGFYMELSGDPSSLECIMLCILFIFASCSVVKP